MSRGLVEPSDAVSLARESASRPRYARWRAVALGSVYVLVAIHLLHWRLAGKTLAPLEFNEVMYTLELGILTAGFIFMALAVVGTAVFGRFFCSWGCHILALQDLCSWILKRLKIRPHPVRSRLLLWVPVVVAFYMFVWPQIERIAAGQALPALHLRTDAQGWASFLTTNFWRNLPGPGVIVATFFFCGFAIVFLMGSRSFCFYACPYGAVFAAMDRIAPGRIRAHDRCKKCGACTAACTSGIRVHEETGRYGMVVNNRCLRDLDCVAACPEGNLYYGFGRPSLFAPALSDRKVRNVYDFTLAEEIAMTAIFTIALLSVRGLYDILPFFLSIALALMLAFLTLVTWRLARRADVWLGRWRLKAAGKVRVGGFVLAACVAVLVGLVVHSGIVRYQMAAGWRDFQSLSSGQGASLASLDVAIGHLSFVDRHGLLPTPRLRDAQARLNYRAGEILFGEGRLSDATARLREGLRLQPENAAAEGELGALLLEQRDLGGAIEHLRAATRLQPDNADAHHNLAVTLHSAGRTEEAMTEIDAALRLTPDDPKSLEFRRYLASMRSR
jgi:polyferredoxin